MVLGQLSKAANWSSSLEGVIGDPMYVWVVGIRASFETGSSPFLCQSISTKSSNVQTIANPSTNLQISSCDVDHTGEAAGDPAMRASLRGDLVSLGAWELSDL